MLAFNLPLRDVCLFRKKSTTRSRVQGGADRACQGGLGLPSFNHNENLRFQTNAQSRFAKVVFDGVWGPGA